MTVPDCMCCLLVPTLQNRLWQLQNIHLRLHLLRPVQIVGYHIAGVPLPTALFSNLTAMQRIPTAVTGHFLTVIIF